MKALRCTINLPLFIIIKVWGAACNKLYCQGRLSSIRRVEIPETEFPGLDGVKMKNHLCGFRAGEFNLIFSNDSPAAGLFGSFHCLPGHETSGEIVQTNMANKSVGS
jgi:threonine dehydrogenase-like Zn-dependent dehydrogenase